MVLEELDQGMQPEGLQREGVVEPIRLEVTGVPAHDADKCFSADELV